MNNKFNELLDIINLDYSNYPGGEIKEIKIFKENLSISISINFPHVLDIYHIDVLVDCLDRFFKETFGYRMVDVTILYNDTSINDDLLYRYFDRIIEKLISYKPRFSVFTCFNRDIVDGKINYYVANYDDYDILNGLIGDINFLLKKYGLSSTVNISVSNFEVPIESIIKKNLEISNYELLKEQEMFENQKKEPAKPEQPKYKKQPRPKAIINRTPTPLHEVPASEVEVIEYRQKFGSTEIVVIGEVIHQEIKEIVSKKGIKYRIFQIIISDKTDSLMCKTFLSDSNPELSKFYEDNVKVGYNVRVAGNVEFDKFANDVVLNIIDTVVLGESEKSIRTDNAPVKRVELHAHTKMSVLDGVMDVNEYVNMASNFGHKAVAVTDTYNVHAFPDLFDACKKKNIKPIFGVEGALVDEETFKIALTDHDIDLRTATYVVYDVETTGLSSKYDEIIEIAAVKIKDGLIIDEFSEYVKPKRTISAFITELTSITNDDVRNSPGIEEILPRFKKFFDGCVLVAHNATFDNSHIYENLKKLGLYEGPIPTIDTLQLARIRYAGNNKLKKFNLKALAKFFDVELSQHHRAIYDSKATGNIFIKMLNDLLDQKIYNYNQINSLIDPEDAYKYSYPTSVTILSKNAIGKKNLYKIVSDSHTKHLYKEPRILKRFLNENREGLLIGSGTMESEIFETAYQKNFDELVAMMSFYDYIEVQPTSTYDVLVQRNKDPKVMDYVKDTIKTIIKAAKVAGKPVVATGNVFHLNKEDKIFREIYIDAPMIGGGTHPLSDIDNVPSFHFMTTEEMLDEFAFLGKELAYEIVVTNSNLIADMIETYDLFPKKLFAPADDSFKDLGIPSFKDGVINMSYSVAKKRYGENIPKYINDRIEKELKSIIGNNFASIYYISHMLVKHSVDDGYVVGSRGSVGSSLIANLMSITEVNPLPPHYYCPKCHFYAIKMTEEEKKIYPRTEEQIKLEEFLNAADTGYDLEEQNCPHCGHKLNQDGVDIPFETFLGFKGDKVPDIDLNFSGEYQARAHEYTRTLFGVDHAFRAGTISTIASKTAYGYIMKYFEKRNKVVRKAEVERLITKVEGVKRSTGQHPGGIVVLPKDIEYTDLIPIQYPADDPESGWRTTHFDYHKFESNLLKLDILGHDDPTMIRHLMDFVEAYPNEFPFSTVDGIPLTDRGVFALFNGLTSLNLTPEQFAGETIGTTGIPEFGTALAKDMLSEIRPQTVSDLLKISGLSHGTGVWQGNSRDFFLGLKEGYPKVPFKELIGCRDDIMVYLMSKNIPANDAFKIMEDVRKGRGVSADFEKLMISYNVPKWYIESCKLIQYMFPKAHATAYVIMALRIGWFKVHRPIFYYAAYFSRRADTFDVVTMARGYEAIKQKVLELKAKIDDKTASAKETDLHYALLLALEMTARGYTFEQMDIRRSDATKFLVSEDRKSLLIPFNALETLGDSIAYSIVNARNEAEFTSKKDVLRRTKITTTQFEKMNMMGVFEGLPEDDQIGLF